MTHRGEAYIREEEFGMNSSEPKKYEISTLWKLYRVIKIQYLPIMVEIL